MHGRVAGGPVLLRAGTGLGCTPTTAVALLTVLTCAALRALLCSCDRSAGVLARRRWRGRFQEDLRRARAPRHPAREVRDGLGLDCASHSQAAGGAQDRREGGWRQGVRSAPPTSPPSHAQRRQQRAAGTGEQAAAGRCRAGARWKRSGLSEAAEVLRKGGVERSWAAEGATRSWAAGGGRRWPLAVEWWCWW